LAGGTPSPNQQESLQENGAGGSSSVGISPGESPQGTTPAEHPQAAAALFPHVITALGQTLTINNSSAVTIGSSTLSVGGPAITSGGNYFSLAPSGNLIAGSVPTAAAPSPPLLTFAGSTYTANSASQFLIAVQTLTPGGVVQVADTYILLASIPTIAVVRA